MYIQSFSLLCNRLKIFIDEPNSSKLNKLEAFGLFNLQYVQKNHNCCGIA